MIADARAMWSAVPVAPLSCTQRKSGGMAAALHIFAIVIVLLFPATAAAARVVFVDNSRPPGGDGSLQKPMTSIAQAAAQGDVIFVAETPTPYIESVTLRRGQMLIGSAYGLDAIRGLLGADAPAMPAAKGIGPTIQGSVILSGDNLVAGCTIVTASVAAISAESPAGPITIRNTYIRTARRAIAIVLSGLLRPASIEGGGIEAAAEGNGIAIYGGNANITFDGTSVAGYFGNAIDIGGRTGGVVMFRGRTAIKIADATQPAVTITACTGRVEFAVPLQITARAPGLRINQAPVKVGGGSSWIATTDATALEIHDAKVEAGFVSVSATGVAAGRLQEGIVVDKLHGTLAISGEEEKPSSGGTIRNARLHGVRITQSSGVRIANMALIDDGRGERAKCDEAVETKTNLQCQAALYLRHVGRSEFSNVTVTGGKQIGVNANNLEDVTFGGLEIRTVGDAPSDAAVLLDEFRGSIRFNRCTLEDAAGGAMVVALQFNAGKLIVDRCSVGATARPAASPSLLVMRSGQAASLDIELRNVEIHDNLGSAIRAEAAGTSSMRLAITDSRIQHFGRTAVRFTTRDQARGTLIMRRTNVFTPGAADRTAIDVSAADGASACVDIDGGQFVTGTPGAPVRVVAASAGAKVSVIPHAGPAVEVSPAGQTPLAACP